VVVNLDVWVKNIRLIAEISMERMEPQMLLCRCGDMAGPVDLQVGQVAYKTMLLNQ